MNTFAYRRNKSNNKQTHNNSTNPPTGRIVYTTKREMMDAEISTFCHRKEIRAPRESLQHFSSLAFIHKVLRRLASKIEGLGITSQLVMLQPSVVSW